MGQNLKLSFMSESGARFFVYLNGKLQNEKSVGLISFNNLEDKPYHVRIVIDDPYQMTATKRLRPSDRKYEYSVNFNSVRERIYIKRLKENKDRVEEKPSKDSSARKVPKQKKTDKKQKSTHDAVSSPQTPKVNRVKTTITFDD